jgi:vacuolar iron transporter family protein
MRASGFIYRYIIAGVSATATTARHHGHEIHTLQGIAWLRAAVLGANDGIVSTASLIVGVAAAHVAHSNILLTGLSGLVAGAMSMACGEYVSVHSQADTEKAVLAQERHELETDFAGERHELTEIYVRRGLERSLAGKVADQLMAHDALGSHARDELGLTGTLRARPLQAAVASAGSFALGASMPLLVAVFAPPLHLIGAIMIVSLGALMGLGALAAKIGGANPLIGALRVTFWSALAMTVTAAVGAAFGSRL